MKKVITIIITICLLLSLLLPAVAEEIDLTVMTKEQLLELRERINSELKESHELTSREQSKLTDAAKKFIETVFEQNNMTVSWAWFNYDYTREWGYATMTTHFDAKAEDKSTTRYDVVVGAYLVGEEWNVVYVNLNGQDAFDIRDRIPDPRLNPAYISTQSQVSTPEPTPTPTPTPIPVVLPTKTTAPEPTQEPTPEPTPETTPEPTPETTPEPTQVPTEAPTPEPAKESEPDANADPIGYMMWLGVPEEIARDREYEVLKRGDKGDDVKALQNDLVFMGLLDGTADGDYGKKTESAVSKYQDDLGFLEVNGIADIETQAWLRFDVYCGGGYEQSDIVSETSKESSAKEMPSELRFGTLLSVTETGENDIVVIKAKIEPSYSNKATVDQNYYNVEYLAQEYGFARYNTVDYWAVADMNDGSEGKVIAFRVSKDIVQLLAEGKIPANKLGDYANDLWIHPSLK